MFEGDHALEQIIGYTRAHWPSPSEWQLSAKDYALVSAVAIQDFAAGKSKNRILFRLAGISGSGKTSQLLPAAEGYFAAKGMKPAVVAAREFVKYHPRYEEILASVDKSDVRKVTDEFATVMLFLVLSQLIKDGVDVILDVSFLAPEMEAILVKMLGAANYELTTLAIAASPKITGQFLGKREWRHTEETEMEFVRSTEKAMHFYAENCSASRIVIWNTYETEPVYDGVFAEALAVFDKYASEEQIPEHDEEAMREAKINYLKR